MNKVKKTSVLALCMAVLCAAGLWGLEFKHYRDYANGYDGDACAIYNSSGEFNLQDLIDLWKKLLTVGGYTINGDCEKLSKEENYLLWKALNEYDIKDGEVYIVIVLQTGALYMLSMLVQITNNGNSCTWRGLYCTMQ